MSGEKTTFEIPGQFEHDGVQYMPIVARRLFDQLPDFEMGGGDVLFSSYPLSTTPFMSDMLYLIHNEADVDKVKAVPHGILVPFLDHVIPNFDPIVELAKAPKPRLLKVHLPPKVFANQIEASKVKAVVLLRNPKDNLAAYYNFYRMTPGPIRYRGTFSEFFELFKEKRLFNGDWFEFALSWWKLRELNNVLVLRYEDVKADADRYVRQVAEFCQQDLSQDHVVKIADYLQNEAGDEIEIGGWKKVFGDEESKCFDELFEEKLEGSGLDFDLSK